MSDQAAAWLGFLKQASLQVVVRQVHCLCVDYHVASSLTTKQVHLLTLNYDCLGIYSMLQVVKSDWVIPRHSLMFGDNADSYPPAGTCQIIFFYRLSI